MLECVQHSPCRCDENVTMPEIYHAPNCTLVSAAKVLSFTTDPQQQRLLSDSLMATDLNPDSDDDLNPTPNSNPTHNPTNQSETLSPNHTHQSEATMSHSVSINASHSNMLSTSGVACSCGAEHSYMKYAFQLIIILIFIKLSFQLLKNNLTTLILCIYIFVP